jgi:hypothetical protein
MGERDKVARAISAGARGLGIDVKESLGWSADFVVEVR